MQRPQNPPFRTHVLLESSLAENGHLDSKWQSMVREAFTGKIEGDPQKLCAFIDEAPESVLWLWLTQRTHQRKWVQESLSHLWKRLSTDARREGIVWTPLLDAAGEKDALQPLLKTANLKLHMKPLKAWVENAKAEELEQLLDFNSSVLKRFVMEHATSWSPALVDWVSNERLFMPALASKESLAGEALDHLARVAWQKEVEEGKKDTGYDPYGRGARAALGDTLQNLSKRGLLPRDVQEEIVKRGKRLDVSILLSNSELDEETFEQVLELSRHTRKWIEAVKHPRFTKELKLQYIKAGGVANALLERGEDDEEVLRTLWRECPDYSRTLAYHEQTPLSMLREMIQLDSSKEIAEPISGREEAARDPVIRKILRNSRAHKVQQNLLRYSTPEDFGEMLSRVDSFDRWFALARLEEGVPEGASVDPDLIKEWLQSTDRRVRMIAMTAVGQVSDSEEIKKEVETSVKPRA